MLAVAGHMLPTVDTVPVIKISLRMAQGFKGARIGFPVSTGRSSASFTLKDLNAVQFRVWCPFGLDGVSHVNCEYSFFRAISELKTTAGEPPPAVS